MTAEISEWEASLFKLTSIVAVGLSLVFQFLIVQSYTGGEQWIQTVNFNAAGEGFLELFVVFPCCLIISAWAFIRAGRL